MSGWQIEEIKETTRGLEVGFVRHSVYVGEESERIRGIFSHWVTVKKIVQPAGAPARASAPPDPQS